MCYCTTTCEACMIENDGLDSVLNFVLPLYNTTSCRSTEVSLDSSFEMSYGGKAYRFFCN